MAEHKLGAYKKRINCINLIKLTTLGSIYSKLDTNGRINLGAHQPHVRLPGTGNIYYRE
jgi:hypothetical protein